MRGAISGGMALALEELGCTDAFDDVYGTSAGALNAAWFVGRAAGEGVHGWADPSLRTATLRRRNVLRGRPVLDGDYLVNVVYEELTPLPFGEVLGSGVRLHPIATDAKTGQSQDLARYVQGIAELKLALRASSALPLLAGPPVELGGRRWFDGGLSESVPFRTALAQGATHVLVLRSRREGEQEMAEQGRSASFVARYLSRYSPELAAAFLDRPAQLASADADLATLQRSPAGPAVLSVRPAPDTPPIGRLERDDARVQAGIVAGREAVQQLLAPAISVS
jgi:predicted patatin/cPLA2 family phospholipase